eukprot:TRINITY_DN395_c0_g1_i11.p1 TRINITY_DN395_c0_g1~~TRINITY_DN395_c0_g1_i11.p1  ORF type:complete len:132 (-),score=11.45 TRINITY_DN395_c0_g1_i11:559-954(-)
MSVLFTSYRDCQRPPSPNCERREYNLLLLYHRCGSFKIRTGEPTYIIFSDTEQSQMNMLHAATSPQYSCQSVKSASEGRALVFPLTLPSEFGEFITDEQYAPQLEEELTRFQSTKISKTREGKPLPFRAQS